QVFHKNTPSFQNYAIPGRGPVSILFSLSRGETNPTLLRSGSCWLQPYAWAGCNAQPLPADRNWRRHKNEQLNRPTYRARALGTSILCTSYTYASHPPIFRGNSFYKAAIRHFQRFPHFL